MDVQTILSHPTMLTYLEGKQEKVGLREVVSRVEKQIEKDLEKG